MDNNFSLAGKVVIVTGGTGILGNSFVNAIVEAGGCVGILGRKHNYFAVKFRSLRPSVK
jgi:NAD(P)-dependent dehydrogenase (short-subunit alcohol dehydrogenase family)